ncbi:DeoR/GlpR family DNA-binding transcription regulator [Pseudoroseomonas cervicalis]|uniref:DeoR/GlpR family DNA-binding transcription regulator n=1 Tax=Teichococcus cervicalis TaxID=204525 RepID=UPI002781E280|nr:DeoR/GlpR family DNA-binding transcription regulator [Pseudoroseomonas cervicalis]MDQ1078095.1 DeoR family fructose operon transcriptional repressor [Pseudoroseomonas cervicalis]
MWSQERHRLIVERLRAQRQLSADLLAQELAVSRETVRRDLVELEQAGLLRRVHGGAVLVEAQPEPPLAHRLQQRRAEKEAIARAAAALPRPGQSCFIDAGSTTALLAAALRPIPELTVITNSLEVAQALRGRPGTALTRLVGGVLSAEMPGLCGEATMAELARYHVDLAFVSPVGLDPREGATNFMQAEAEIARLMLQRSRRPVLLADHAKLGRVSRLQICGCSGVHTLVTDSQGGEMAESFRQAGITEVLVAQG